LDQRVGANGHVTRTFGPTARTRGQTLHVHRASAAPPADLREVVDAALGAVRYTNWVAIHYGQEREIAKIFASQSGPAPAPLGDIARAEHALHLVDVPSDVVVRSRAALAPFAHGLTLICGDGEGIRSLVVVLRDEQLGRFSEDEAEALRDAAGSISSYVAASRKAVAVVAHQHARARREPAFFVLNSGFEIELSWLPDVMSGLCGEIDSVERLSPLFEAAVRGLTADWNTEDPASLVDGVAAPDPTHIVRTVPLRGRAGLRIGVTIERLKTRNAIRSAAFRFGLSPRELDVLALLLQGSETREVADALRIAPSTASDHIKRMLVKTHSRNRAELIAHVLGWKTSP
jgi:DNA-binding CsgD family transcriptional regulator